MARIFTIVSLISMFCLISANFSFGQAGQLDVIQRRGEGRVRLEQYSNGHWQLLVEDKPYFIKGVAYLPVKVGRTLSDSNIWMSYDFNSNGLNDTAYESWVDKNKNNIQDTDEPAVGDYQLLKEMGCNTIRIYHYKNIRKELLRDLYQRYGIMVVMGNFLGAYTRGSDASWDKGTDYRSARQRRDMLEDVKKMVLEYKDEPYVLFWVLGNENDMEGSYANSTYNNTNARLFPEVYSKFLNEVAEMIHELDPNHPVAVCNGSTSLLRYFSKFSPQIDIVGLNSYRGPFGFGTLWNIVKFDFDRPVVITEYGVDCYDQNNKRVDEDFQERYHKGCWRDIVNNSFNHEGAGNSLGGFVYTWLDSWWLCAASDVHDVEAGSWRAPTNDGWMNDEWLGICSQGNGQGSPFVRQLRKVYFMYKEEWGR
jgi:beta-glucuronidase